MRIKSLEITGFKSFVDKTVLRFQPGITAIVGPNGCGKSNVVDAMRWAMGEMAPRRLRGKSMEDVVFAGSEGRAPVGMAEVVLTFDNSDGRAPPAFASYSEIQVARRLYRSGESEYLINKVNCRLRDVLDFFRDTGIGTRGYTIVEQGQIGAIVSAKPEERRVLIEEAAGISKYKARRIEAERKIQATEVNLTRVSDVLAELRRQISSIERQARKAARYKSLRALQRTLDLSLASEERRDLLEEIGRARSRLQQLLTEASAAETRVSENELSLEQVRLQLVERERALGQDTEVLLGLRGEIKQLESRVQYETRERENLGDLRRAREEELVGLRQQLGQSREALARSRDEVGGLEGALEAEAEQNAAVEREAAQAGEALRTAERERDAAQAALVDLLTHIARAEDRLATLGDRRAEIDRRLRSADEQLEVQQNESARAAREQHDLEAGLRNLLAERDRLMGALRGALEQHETAASRLREATDQLREVRDRRETRRARLASLQELLGRREDLGEGTRRLLEQDERGRAAHGLRGLVRDVLEVERGLEAAVEAVLAERAEAVVVGRPEGALSALEVLREGALGRGSFVFEPRGEATPPGFVPLGQPLLDRVQARPGFEGVVRALMAGVNLVPHLREVLEVYGGGRIPATFVTPEGDLLTPGGLVSGGAPLGGGALARAREVRELEGEVGALDAEVAAAEAAYREAEAQAQAASDELDNTRNRHHTAALAVANHEKDLERTRERAKTLSEVQEDRAAQRSGLLTETEVSVEEARRRSEQLTELRDRKAAQARELEAVGLRVSAAARELTRLETVLTERRVERSARVEARDRLLEGQQRAEQAVRETGEWIERREREIAAAEERRTQLASSLQEAERTLAAALEREEALRASHDEKRDAYEREAARGREIEDQGRQLRTEVASRRGQAQRAELDVKESELRLEHLEQALGERWSVDLASWTPEEAELVPDDDESAEAEAEAGSSVPPATGEAAATAAPEAAPIRGPSVAELVALPREERRERLEKARQRLQALGEVNLGALEEHEELRDRFRFLGEQKADLESTLASLREAIARINRTSRKRFRETFEAVNERFQQNFPRLFRGGKASLSLAEVDDILEAGVEIMAQPPGKRLQNVNLLSGGEKTLTALSLLIALFQVRPSPFFLLDEVDAPLDDANVGRFNEIVREMSKESQFLLITHNKSTIEVADLLYGVTMEEKGVSTLVAVDLR